VSILAIGYNFDPAYALPTFLRECGGILNVRFGPFHSGYILYKEKENLASEENCIWTIRSNESVAFDMSFELQGSGLEAGVDSIRMYSFDVNRAPINITSTDLSLNTVHHGFGPVAFVHFTSKGSSGQGFRLQVLLTTPRYPLDTYQDANFHTTFGALDPYVSTGAYGNNEFSSFVINNANTSFSTPVTLNTHIFSTYNCMGGCCDRIHFFKIENNQLEHVSSPCYANNITNTISSIGPKIVLFKSDETITSRGFKLDWQPDSTFVEKTI
jgi:hypothetical protein